jgi:hypothetical protein
LRTEPSAKFIHRSVSSHEQLNFCLRDWPGTMLVQSLCYQGSVAYQDYRRMQSVPDGFRTSQHQLHRRSSAPRAIRIFSVLDSTNASCRCSHAPFVWRLPLCQAMYVVGALPCMRRPRKSSTQTAPERRGRVPVTTRPAPTSPVVSVCAQ